LLEAERYAVRDAVVREGEGSETVATAVSRAAERAERGAASRSDVEQATGGSPFGLRILP
jgi:hypothetical protein